MTTIIVRFQQPGFHNWPEAPPKRSYLKAAHRHNFHFQVELQVFSAYRDIELHDLRDTVKTALYVEFVGEDVADNLIFGSKSCEAIALWILRSVKAAYPPADWGERWCAVEVWEDGEVGARVEER